MARRVRRTNGPLDLREQAILRAVIEEYVVTATPVGSVALVERYGLGVSSATVRVGPRRARGRRLPRPAPHERRAAIPTDHGYRYYVSSIVDAPPLSPVEELMIRHQFGQVEAASEHWFRLAATTLAGLTHAAGLATPAKPRAARVRRVDLVAIQDRLASLILVLREGSIKQILLTLDEAVDQAALSAAADRLNRLFADQTARQIDATLVRFDPEDPANVLVRKVAERIARTMREFDTALIEELFSDGLLNVMEAPEFAQSDKLRRVFSALENRAWLGELLRGVASSGRVQVFIGGENEPPGDARRLARPGAVRPTRPGGRGRRRARADPDELRPRDRHRPVRRRAHERAHRPARPEPTTTITSDEDPATTMPHRTRAEERMAEIDISPTKLLADIEQLTKERDEALARADEYLAGLQRERAEFLNFKRRTEQEGAAAASRAADSLRLKVLDALDDFDRAIEARPAALADDPWADGIAAIDRKLRGLLEREDVRPMASTVGQAVRSAPAPGAQPRGRLRATRRRDRRRVPARLLGRRSRPPTRPRRRLGWRGFHRSHPRPAHELGVRHRHGQDHRHRPRHDQLGGRRHGGRRADRHRLRRRRTDDPVGRRVHQDRRAPRRPARQAPGRHQPGQHRLFDQALHGPPLGRPGDEAGQGARPVQGREGRQERRRQGRSRRRQELHAAGDQRDDPPEAQDRRRGLSRREGDRGGHHGPGLLRRHPAPGDQGRRPDRRPRRQADHQRADGVGAGLRPRQEARREGRRVRPGRRHVRHLDPRAGRGRLRGQGDQRRHPPRRRRLRPAGHRVARSRSSRRTRASTCAPTRRRSSASRRRPRRRRSSSRARCRPRSTCRTSRPTPRAPSTWS